MSVSFQSRPDSATSSTRQESDSSYFEAIYTRLSFRMRRLAIFFFTAARVKTSGNPIAPKPKGDELVLGVLAERGAGVTSLPCSSPFLSLSSLSNSSRLILQPVDIVSRCPAGNDEHEDQPRGSNGAATSGSSLEDALLSGPLPCLSTNRFSSNLAIGCGPTFDQHARKGELCLLYTSPSPRDGLLS